MVESADTFAEVFDRERKARRWTKSGAARYFGVNQSTVSRWCSGDLLPGEDLIPQLAEFLGLDPDTVRSLKYDIEPVSFAKLESNQDDLIERVSTVETEMGRLRHELGLLHRIIDRIAAQLDEPVVVDDGDPPLVEFHSEVPVTDGKS